MYTLYLPAIQGSWYAWEEDGVQLRRTADDTSFLTEVEKEMVIDSF